MPDGQLRVQVPAYVGAPGRQLQGADEPSQGGAQADSVGTAVFGLLCFGSLLRDKPLMYSMALEFIGPDSAQGREFAHLWQYWEFRHTFRVITCVWGGGYLIEAAIRVVIVANTSTGTALATSKVLPYAVAAVLIAWTIGYGRLQKRRGEAIAAVAAADGGGGQQAAGATPEETAPGNRHRAGTRRQDPTQ